jgi:hypothetical protein
LVILICLTIFAGVLFLKRFKDAVAMRKKHADAFEQFSSTFDIDTRTRWARMVDEWLADRKKPNPYQEPIGREFS